MSAPGSMPSIADLLALEGVADIHFDLAPARDLPQVANLDCAAAAEPDSPQSPE